jgi:hypothetical protein
VTKTPIENSKAAFLPSFILILAADILRSPGGTTPTNAAMKPIRKLINTDIKDFYTVNITNYE